MRLVFLVEVVGVLSGWTLTGEQIEVCRSRHLQGFSRLNHYADS